MLVRSPVVEAKVQPEVSPMRLYPELPMVPLQSGPVPEAVLPARMVFCVTVPSGALMPPPPWGQKSKWAMVALCKGQVVTAKLNGERSRDRLVATCYLPDGRDIGAELIKQGMALDWAQFSGGSYRHLEPEGARKKLAARLGSSAIP